METWDKNSPHDMVLGEAIAWKFDFADVGVSDPSAAGDTIALDQTGRDVSTAVLTSTASLSGSVITGKKFTPASAQRYILKQPATIDGNTVNMLCAFYVAEPGLT